MSLKRASYDSAGSVASFVCFGCFSRPDEEAFGLQRGAAQVPIEKAACFGGCDLI